MFSSFSLNSRIWDFIFYWILVYYHFRFRSHTISTLFLVLHDLRWCINVTKKKISNLIILCIFICWELGVDFFSLCCIDSLSSPTSSIVIGEITVDYYLRWIWSEDSWVSYSFVSGVVFTISDTSCKIEVWLFLLEGVCSSCIRIVNHL